MKDTEQLRAQFIRSVDAWTALDVDAIVGTGAGNGFGYRARDARTTAGESAEETRSRIAAVIAGYEYFRIIDVDWHAKVDDGLAIEWGFFTEEFQNKGLPPERVRVRFSIIGQRTDDENWHRVWEHRDAQPFDADGRYLRHPLRTDRLEADG